MSNRCPIAFNLTIGEQTEVVTSDELAPYADGFFLNLHAEGRYSWLFVFQLMLAERLRGIDPFQVSDEIRSLEKADARSMTKPASQYCRDSSPLKGLWHKHYFSARFLLKNLQLQHASGGWLTTLVEEVFDPKKSEWITPEMIGELAHRATHGALEERSANKKVTGEWIVFAKYEGQNYYLSLANHTDGDQLIYNNIKAACWQQFPFLESLMAKS